MTSWYVASTALHRLQRVQKKPQPKQSKPVLVLDAELAAQWRRSKTLAEETLDANETSTTTARKRTSQR
jgi:hypothetical protein